MLTQERGQRTARSDRGAQTPVVARGYPLLGLIPQIVADPMRLFLDTAGAHPGQVVRLDLGLARPYLITHPDHLDHVFQKNWRNYGKGPAFKRMERLVGKSLVAAEGEWWLRMRRAMQAILSAEQIARFATNIADSIETTLEHLAPAAASGAPVDIEKEMQHLAQRTILRLIFSTSLDSAAAKELIEAFTTALQFLQRRMLLFFVPDELPLPGDRLLNQAIRTMDSHILRAIRESRRSGEDRGDLISTLLRVKLDDDGRGLSDTQLRDEVVGMFGAGTSTIGSVLTWLWYLLDAHPEVDAQLRAELDAELGGRIPSVADLKRLRYTQQVVQEVMRLYPTGWLIPRVANSDDVIGGYAIEAGAVLLLSPYVTHRDPAFWERPLTFDPDRFSPERSSGRPRFAYLPFGGGPRHCAGNHLALLELHMMVAMFAQRYRPRLSRARPVEVSPSIVLRPRHGMNMTLRDVRPAAPR